MSESLTLDLHRTKALELAVEGGGTHEQVIARANAFHDFLTKGTGKPNASAAQTPASATSKPAAATGKPAVAATGKPAVAATGKPAVAATGKPAAAPKATPAPGTKPTASAKPGAAAPKAAVAGARPAPKGDTKDPKGKNTYIDVVTALQKVMRSVPGDSQKREKGRALAYKILADKGDGVKCAGDLKPALYDTVVAGCETAIKGAGASKAATVVANKTGEIVDTSGANAETAGDDDPPEGGAGEEVESADEGEDI